MATKLGDRGDPLKRNIGRVQYHPVTDRIYPPPSRPSGQLGELARQQQLMALPGELGEPIDDHGPGRHVDPQRQGFGGEHQLDQTVTEQLFGDLFEGRYQPGMVGGYPLLQPRQPAVVAQGT